MENPDADLHFQFCLALRAGDAHRIQECLAEGADPNRVPNHAIRSSAYAPGGLDSRDLHPLTVLMISDQGHRVDLMQLLMDHGADPFIGEPTGYEDDVDFLPWSFFLDQEDRSKNLHPDPAHPFLVHLARIAPHQPGLLAFAAGIALRRAMVPMLDFLLSLGADPDEGFVFAGKPQTLQRIVDGNRTHVLWSRYPEYAVCEARIEAQRARLEQQRLGHLLPGTPVLRTPGGRL
jgi:hypothetical protein